MNEEGRREGIGLERRGGAKGERGERGKGEGWKRGRGNLLSVKNTRGNFNERTAPTITLFLE